MSLRTPLGKVLGLGAAKDGTDHFVSQRLSAIALAGLGLWFLFAVSRLDSLAYLDVIRFLRIPINAILLTLLSATVCYHSYLGVQVVIEDYVKGGGTKVAALIASRFAHIILAITAIYSIFSIGIGS